MKPLVGSKILDRFRPLIHRVIGALIRHQTGLPGRIIRHNERIVLFYVEFAASFDGITGIQRVCHQLAAMLESNGETLVLIKLDPATLRFAPLDANERAHFFSRAGYASAQDDRLYEPAIFDAMLAALRGQPRRPWLVIPEVTYHTRHRNPPTPRLIKLARDFGLRVGVIYYGVIPFLGVDASENAYKHAEYASTIAVADTIWPISHWSANVLRDHYRRYDKLADIEMPTILVATLAEEMDTQRQTGYGDTGGHSIVCVGTVDERKS
jgi:hypothetical protein